MMVYAFPLLIAGLAGMTNETIDRILLKHLLPSTVNSSHELGLYGRNVQHVDGHKGNVVFGRLFG